MVLKHYSLILLVALLGLTSTLSHAALGAPEITQDPVAQTVDFGGTATFTGVATGASTLTYQWYYGTTALVNGTGISGATTNTLTLTNVDFNDAGQYSLKATNGLGNDTSAETTLTVQKRPGAILAGNLPTFSGSGYAGSVNAIQPLSDGSYLVGGVFEEVTINGVKTTRQGLVRIKADGSLDTNFPTVNSTNRPSVHAIIVDSSGRIFIAGDFTSVVMGATETARLRVARLTSAFALDTAFNTSTVGPDKIVRALATSGDGSVYIGGEFTTIGSTAIRYMAKLNASGAQDNSFTNSISTGAQDNNKSVNSIVRLADGTLYVGSNVSNWSTSIMPGFNLSSLVKLSASGNRDNAFNPFPWSSGFFGASINAIIRLSDGSLFAGGNPLATLKRFNGTTGADLGFTLPGHFIQTYALARQADGKLLSGSYGVLKRTDSNLVVDPNFNIGAGFDNYIRVITTDTAGRIYIGGDFSTFNGASRNRFVILNGGDLDSRTASKPGQTITFADIADRAFAAGGAAANTITISPPTSNSTLPVTTVVTSGPATLQGNSLTFTGVGTVVLTASQAGNDNFAAATVSQTITVSKASQTLTFSQMPDVANASAPIRLGATASSGMPVSYLVLSGPATVSGNTLTLTGEIGIVSLRASQPGNSDFTAANAVEQSFEVFIGTPIQMPQNILFNPLPSRSLSEPLTFTLDASATSGLPLSYTFTGPVTSIVGNTVTLSGATGTVAITAKQVGNDNFLAAVDVKQSFAVTAAVTSLTLTNLIQTYTGTPRAIGTVGTEGMPVISYTIAGVKGITPPTNAGKYAVEVVVGTVKKTGSLVINKAPLVITADSKRKFAGQDNPELTFAYNGFLGSDNAANALTKAPTVTTTAKTTSPGGDYPITPAGGTSANYAFIYVKGNMKVESWAGQYEALLEDPITSLPVGKLEITILSNSVGFTGKFTTAKQTAAVPFKGNLTLDVANEIANGIATASGGTGEALAKYDFTFELPLDGDFTASVTRAVGIAATVATNFGTSHEGKKLVFPTGKPPVTYAGAYTLIFAPDSTANALPRPLGYGHATATIDAKGKLTLTGTLADGTKIAASLLPDADAGYRLYLLPYKGRLDSYCAAWIELQEHPDHTGRGIIRARDMKSLYWAKAAMIPVSKDTNYRGGIPESVCSILMDPWLPPVSAKAPNPAFTLPQRLVLNGTGDMDVLYDGLPDTLDLSGLPALVRMNSAGKVNVLVTTPANPRAWKIAITPTTGAFTGSHTTLDGLKSATVNFTGVMRQPPSTEASPALIGAGFSIVPQLTNQTNGTLSSAIHFTRPVSVP